MDHFWDSNYYNHPPLTDKMILEAESTLNVSLPDELVSLLKIQNGGYTKNFILPLENTEGIPVDSLYGIVTDKTITTAQNILDTEYLTKEWDLPEKQVILLGEGHWWITLDYRKSREPTVVYIDVDDEYTIKISDSFKGFINSLIPDDV